MDLRSTIKKILEVALPLGLYSAIGVLLLPIYSRVLTAAEMGIVELITAGAAIFQIVFTFEIGQAMARFLPDAKNKKELSVVFSTAMALTLVGAFLGALITYFANHWLLNLLGASIENIPSSTLICSYLILIVLHRIFQLALIYANHQRAAAQANLSYVAVLAASTGFFFYFDFLNLRLIYFSQIVSYVIAFFVSVRCCQRVGLEMSIWKISKIEAFRQISFSSPILGSSIAVFLLMYYDRLLMAGMVPLSDLGVFSVANRLVSAFVFGLLALGTGLTPLIYSNYRDKNFMRMVELLFYAFITITFSSMLVTSLFGVSLVSFVTTAQYGPAGKLLAPLLVAAFLANSYRFFPGLDVALKTPAIALINMFSCIVGVSSGYVLGQKWGVHGIIASKVVASAVMALLYLELGRSYVRPPRFARLMVLSLSAAALLAL